MEIQQDFKDLFELFNEEKVEYLIVGAYALAYHGVPRYTGDIDIFINATNKNARAVLNALNKFGFGNLGLSIDDLTKEDQVIQLGYPPIRIDIMTSIDGVSFDEAYTNSLETHYGNIAVKMINKQNLIKNKKATGRHKDFGDIEALGEKLDF